VSALVATWTPSPSAQQPLRIHFFDVGRGDAILIQSPTGHNVVYDGGGERSRFRETLESLGVDRVDLVIASHDDPDHIGGLIEVVRRFRPRLYLDNGFTAATPVQQRLLDAVRESGSERLQPEPRRIWASAVSITVVPPPAVPGWDQQDNSVGILIEYGRFRLSLTGDAGPRQWAWWEHKAGPSRPVTVHKASRHGSSDGDTEEGLAVLSPEVVVISGATAEQLSGSDALQLYAAHGATVYRTDLQGTIRIDAESSGSYSVRVER
jgi:beta-lactamase superfamily II metal-dependent hydrolase